ncbi:hypothetical protein H2509_02525 [Stappia sp. F7233]|uniref:Uncharacterized protein n=1 Tax=Stappia albiluteola TaxID=2758565 RepID=A0A839A9Z1_9HYPH|nr:hypothetical protein [Stappia albiluteola]MBA5775996.1 hypothetical protein [Stappia albiluteola]
MSKLAIYNITTIKNIIIAMNSQNYNENFKKTCAINYPITAISLQDEAEKILNALKDGHYHWVDRLAVDDVIPVAIAGLMQPAFEKLAGASIENYQIASSSIKPDGSVVVELHFYKESESVFARLLLREILPFYPK